ncbi:MAG: U32 family peptidase [Dysgonamonadaceae bacterium]|nr:U32 family peptidase [Dysgonamonadaceae bacterium]
MKTGRAIELLSPARNLSCGIEAVNHGADAVYIGAPQFGARSAAGNSMKDIEQLVQYAHRYFSRVYVALNTILKEDDLSLAERMIGRLYNIGVDSLIIQDMSILEMDIPPIALHASTQMDNRTPEKVRFLEAVGFSQVVLARELSLDEVSDISRQTHVALEAFIHGALCVSYSGQCYMSQATAGRSANRGECAQCCRLPYTLQDATGRILATDKHLLSLKDLNRSDALEDLLDAGITALKIEGRLKDLAYVKNVTAHYRKKLDALFMRRPEYVPASSGQVQYTFTPDIHKSFNRGFTDYFLKGRKKEIVSFNTPKSTGEYIGSVKELGKNYLSFAGTASLHNGDGLCFTDDKGVLQGFRANRVENNKIFPAEMPVILPKTLLYRNFDQAFEKQLTRQTAERKIRLCLHLKEEADGLSLHAQDEDGCESTLYFTLHKELAQKCQEEQIKMQLSKLGNTIFQVEHIAINLDMNSFIPASFLSEMKRKMVEDLLNNRKLSYRRILRQQGNSTVLYPQQNLSYRGNVANSKARLFYQKHGVTQIDDAFELNPKKNVPLMFTKHCLRYSFGYCLREHSHRTPVKEPLYLLSPQGRFELEFDCKLCEMRIMASACT